MVNNVTFYGAVVWIALVVLPLETVQSASMQGNGAVASIPIRTNSSAEQNSLPVTNRLQTGKALSSSLVAAASKHEIASLSLVKEMTGQGKETEAIRVCDELIRKGSFDVREALRQKGLCLHRLGRLSEACLCWEYMLRGRMAQSKDDDILLKLASTYAFSLRQPAKAEKYYQYLLKQQPPGKYFPDAQYQYAGIRYVAKDYTNAMVLFQKHQRDFPGSVYAEKVNEYLGLCKKAIEAQEMVVMSAKVKADEEAPRVVKKSRTQQEFEEAEALFMRKLYKEAFKTYQAVANDSYCHERNAAIYRMGQCCSELGKDEEAIRHWGKIVKPRLGETNTQYAVQSLKAIGDAYFDKLADDESAMKYYRKLVATYPEDSLIPAVMEKIGIIYLYQGKMEEAKPVFEALRPATPDPNEPPTGLDRLIALCNGQAAPQLPDLKVVARDNRATVALRKADIFFTAKRYEEALHAYKTAESLVKGSEDSARALMQVGRCYRQLGEFQKALECYNHFLVTYRRSSLADDVLMRIASLDCLLANQAGMTECYRRILKEYPDGDMAWQAQLSLATMAYWSRDWAKALKLHEEFVQKFPGSPCIELVVAKRMPEIKAALGAKKAPQTKKA